MNFIEAVQQMKKGNHVRLPDWKKDRFFCINNGLIYNTCWCNLYLAFDEPYGLSEREFLNTEWEIVRVEEELPKLHTFEEVIKALKDGKKIKRISWLKKELERDFCDDYSISFTIDDIEANDWIILDN